MKERKWMTAVRVLLAIAVATSVLFRRRRV